VHLTGKIVADFLMISRYKYLPKIELMANTTNRISTVIHIKISLATRLLMPLVG
ncbi:MAG: hypothetical protein ACI90G_001904, partial [Urechidicola sp.]